MPRRRYTEAKLAPICAELFRDIDCDTVDFVDNYDGTMKEPDPPADDVPERARLGQPRASPSAWRASICGFNLAEVCDTTIASSEKSRSRHRLHPACAGLSHRRARSSATRTSMRRDLRDRPRRPARSARAGATIKKENVIEVYEIPYTTTIEVIHRQGRRARQGRQGQGDQPTCATRRICPA